MATENRGFDPDETDATEGGQQLGDAGDREPVTEADIPVHGDPERANELAEEAYGDEDDDGIGDVPNAPFPG